MKDWEINFLKESFGLHLLDFEIGMYYLALIISNKGAPMHPANTHDYEKEIQKQRGWNFFVNVGDLTFVNLSISFIFSSTILPLYASYLTTSAVLIGLIPAIQQVGLLLPQLFMARKAESLSRKKPFIVKLSVTERLPYLIIAILIFLWPGAPNWFAYTVLAINLLIAKGSAGLADPAWKAMIGKVVHPNRRGLLFSLGFGLGALLGIGGAAWARYILNTYSFPISFGFCFLLSFVAQSVSWLFLTLNREPAKKPSIASPPLSQYMKELPSVLRNNLNFSWFIIGSSLVILGGMGVSFYIIFARRAFDITDGFAAGLTIVALISQALSIPLLGWMSDRKGHKWFAELSALVGVGALVILLFAPNQSWMYPIFILMNLSVTGFMISRHSITIDFGGIDKVPTFSALASTLLAAPTLIAPIIGGWVLDLIGFRTLFIIALTVSLAGWAVLRFRVRDPRIDRFVSPASND